MEDNKYKDFYDLLGVEQNSSKSEIKKKSAQLIKQYHPDKDKGSKNKFKIIREARSILTDDEERRKYDELGHQRYVSKFVDEEIEGFKFTNDKKSKGEIDEEDDLEDLMSFKNESEKRTDGTGMSISDDVKSDEDENTTDEKPKSNFKNDYVRKQDKEEDSGSKFVLVGIGILLLIVSVIVLLVI